MSLSPVRTLILGPAMAELERGCDDRAVFGGFSKFVLARLEQWAKDEPGQNANIKRAIEVFSNYLSLDITSREKAVNDLLKFARGHYVRQKPVPRQKIYLKTDTPLASIPGIGPERAKLLKKLGLVAVLDALNHFPIRFIDRTKVLPIAQLSTGTEATVFAKVLDVREPRAGRNFVQALFGDSTGKIMATWFNNPYVLKKLAIGKTVALYGKVGDYGGPHMTNPDLDTDIQDMGIVPVYPLTAGLPQWVIRSVIKKIVDNMPEIGDGYLPDAVKKSMSLPSLRESYEKVHFPDNFEQLKLCEKRLVLDEFLLMETALLLRRAEYRQQDAPIIKGAQKSSKDFLSKLPFEPTIAQKRCCLEIAKDLESGRPMNRLLHGDVGSGKTVVGLSACSSAAKLGYQVAWIAPTEILASQTYNVARKLLPFNTAYLSGSSKKMAREKIFELLSSGEPCVLFGTHALLEDWVKFENLGLVVVDEQHRFGVLQRARLAKKGFCPHVLVMSATPIPRTLAMTIYGDLDVSVVDEMPKGRATIETKVLTGVGTLAYKTALAEIEKGRQVYVVCPLVEESEKLSAKAATKQFVELTESHFKGIPCGLLHGRMPSKEKDEVMCRFRDKELKILVSTTVIEVGIDVPNATVMIIENAERFGLAQLHQLRGRVGRGEHKSYCFLIPSRPTVSLQVLERTANGLEVAEEDLKLRGPGDIGGTMQSGLPMLASSRLITPSNFPLLSLAREIAEDIIKHDPELRFKENRELRTGIEGKMAQRVGLAWVS